MYYNIADRTIRPALEQNFDLVSRYASDVQQAMIDAAGFGFQAIAPELNQDRVQGILNRVASEERLDSIAWILDEPVKTFAMSVVDDFIRANAEFQHSAGLTTKLTRKVVGSCCAWCARLAGSYEYDEAPDDIFRRHDRCRCLVTCDTADGRRKIVHSGTEGKRKYVKDEYGGYELTAEVKAKKSEQLLQPINPETKTPYVEHELRMDDKQVGHKIGKYAEDFGLDPGKAEDRERMNFIINDCVNHADERCYGSWRGYDGPVVFHIKGDNVVVESKNGGFITILKGGVDNARVKNARNK